MAENHGGKRTPRNPAPVSGPGQLSRRTDGQTTTEMTGMGYGENADFNDIQSSAPLSAAPTAGMKASASGGTGGGRAQATPLFAPTSRPDEPVTAGAPFGPGDTPAPESDPRSMMRSDAQMLAAYLPGLMRRAEQPDSPAGFVQFVRYLRDMQGA